ncbi:hypothetical protein CONLIGDRAFT_288699 [Coniochaeta ligniaria NRRL 30616]|uniref:Uncharacterized protein n=1 Tax=Coniochaeta ligniaria NRRL 30616 TaxID=1408157 RepID=A0A1J7JN18_9PEZI|nr:hypothetical protein CONLIGDRAFT_288699 [Coniochaeta ligniaria NRRL 30616]
MDAQVAFRSNRTTKVDLKLRRILYPPVLLLICWPRVCNYPYKTRREIDQPPTSTSSPEQVFRDFVSKLAFLFWTDISPATIPACAVLNHLDIIGAVEYVFAFNNRSPSELQQLKEKIQSVLDMFDEPPSSDERKKDILRNVLPYCVKRVKGYLNAFGRNLGECITSCARDTGTEATEIVACLRTLLNATRKTLTSVEQGGGVNIAATEQLIWSVHSAYKSPVFKIVQDRALKEERGKSSTHWTELIHVTGRLMTYKQAIDLCFMVRETWPQLFQDVHITMVQSDASAPQVLNTRALTAKEIIGKMTSDKPKLEELFASVDKLGDLGIKLDQEIKKEWSKTIKSKDICVHAEINLFQHLEMTEGGRRFFQGIEFIGSSKPPCKLCSYFFQVYPTDVEVRPSHRNLYGTWLMPDICPDLPSTRGQMDSLEMGRKIAERLLGDLLQAVRARERDGGPHDSSNYSTRRGPQSQQFLEDMSHRTENSDLPHETGLGETDTIDSWSRHGESSHVLGAMSTVRVQASIDDMSRDMGSLSIRSGQPGTWRMRPSRGAQSRGPAQMPCRTVVEIESDDDDGGGTLLFEGRGSLRTGIRRR